MGVGGGRKKCVLLFLEREKGARDWATRSPSNLGHERRLPADLPKEKSRQWVSAKDGAVRAKGLHSWQLD